jgi:hypothetical protein
VGDTPVTPRAVRTPTGGSHGGFGPASPSGGNGNGGGGVYSLYGQTPREGNGGGGKGNQTFNISIGDDTHLLRVVPRAPLPACIAGGSISGRG